HGIAYVTHAILHEPAVGRREHRGAVWTLALERHLHRAERGDVGAGVHGEAPRRLPRALGVDFTDTRVRVRRSHDHCVRLAGEVHVVVKSSLAPHEAGVFESLDRLANTELGGRGHLAWRSFPMSA